MTPLHLSLTGLWKSTRGNPADPGEPPRGPGRARVLSELRILREAGHRSIRILDLDCGNGERLLRAAAGARELGFVAIEGRGACLSSAGIRYARHQARLQAHPSTSLIFEMAEPIAILASEHDGAVDLVLLSDPRPYPASPLAAALDRVCTGEVIGGD